jgi:two-component system nitrate/nitrite response regulator NarL
VSQVVETETPTSERTMEAAAMAPQTKKVRVVVADDHPLYREGVVRALSGNGQFEIVAEAEDGRTALAEIEHHIPDVALLDFKLPGLDGLAITRAVVRDGLRTRVPADLRVHRERDRLQGARGGAAGFIAKEARQLEIVDAVAACARGDNVLPPDLASGLISEIRLRASNDRPVLTKRESEILS